MGALQDIPPQVRQALYWVFFVVGLAIGAAQVAYLASDHGDPDWLKVSIAVFGFLTASLHLTAASNVPSYEDVVHGDAPPPEV